MYSPELIRQLQSRYLQNESRYDKWGAQGKLLLVQEFLHTDSRIALEPLINAAFPRTFACQNNPRPLSSDEIQEYYFWMKGMLDPFLEEPVKAERIAVEETAEKFCTRASDIEDLVL